MRELVRLRCFGFLAIMFLLFVLSGCAGIGTAIEHRNPEVVTSTSDALFLDLYGPQQIFVKYRNASGHDEMNQVLESVAKRLRENGHTIVQDHKKADLIISATTLNANKVKKSASELKGGGNEGMVAGAAAGASAGISEGDPVSGILGGVAGAAAGGLADVTVNSMVQVGTITMVTDIQVAKRVEGQVKTETKSVVEQGGGTGDAQTKQVKEGTSDYMKYRMQAVTRVKKASLDWTEVDHLFVEEVSQVIGGIV